MKKLSLALTLLAIGCSSYQISKGINWEELALENGHHFNEHRGDKFERKSERTPSNKVVVQDACEDQNQEERDTLEELIRELGGTNIRAERYEKTVTGFQEYLRDGGVTKYFTSKEILSAHNSGAAQSCYGSEYLIPSHCRWPSALAQSLMAIEMRKLVGKPIKIRNWWRPNCYNTKVSGARRSDHIQARGFDIDFPTGEDRAKAQKFLCEFYKEKGEYSLQTGIGCNTLHIGMGSTKRLSRYPNDGSRFWKYGSLRTCNIKRLEGDDCWKQGPDGKLYIYTDDGKGVL